MAIRVMYLVNDVLSRVGKVYELRLPEHQGVGVVHEVAELEPEDAVLGEGAVAHGVGRLVGVQVGQGLVGGLVTGLVMEHVMPLGECPSLLILARQSDMDTLLEQRTEGHGLRHGPVHLPLGDHVVAILEDSLHSPVDLEVGGVGQALAEPLADVVQGLLVNPRVSHLQRILALKKAGPGRIQPVLVECLKWNKK